MVRQTRSGRAHGVERHLVELVVVAIHEAYRHLFCARVDVDETEELEAGGGRQICPLFLAWGLHIFEFRAERAVKLVGAERAGGKRAGNEFPERLEVLEGGLSGL